MRGEDENLGRGWWLLAAVWLFAAAFLTWRAWSHIGPLLVPDTDDAMRLLEVRDWLGGQPWGDVTQYRMNPPGGVPMHWSRLVDLPLAAVIELARPLAGEALAERIAATLVPLVTLGATIGAAALVGLRLGGRRAALLAGAFIPTIATVTQILRPLRIDHHGWQTALLLVAVAMLADPHRRQRSGMLGGLAVTLSLAIGLEMLPFLLIVCAAPVVAWWIDESYARLLKGLGAGIAVSLPVLFFAFVPTTVRWLPYCDALSPVYLLCFTAAGAAALLAPSLLAGRPRWIRIAATAAAFAGIALVTAIAYPQCALGPLNGIDPRLLPWLRNISEARPALSLLEKQPGVALGTSLFPIIGVVCAVINLFHARPGTRLGSWVVLLIAASGAAITVFVQLRATMAASALADVAGGVLVGRLLPRVRNIRGMLPRILATAGLLLAVSGAGALGTAIGVSKVLDPGEINHREHETQEKDRCNFKAVLAPLNRIPPATLANVLNMGPALLLHTHHRVIGGPYHRSPDMLLDNMRLWRAGDAEARRILAARHADYVLACRGAVELDNAAHDRPRSLAAQLKSGRVPAWLVPVPMPKGSPLGLYRIKG